MLHGAHDWLWSERHSEYRKTSSSETRYLRWNRSQLAITNFVLEQIWSIWSRHTTALKQARDEDYPSVYADSAKNSVYFSRANILLGTRRLL